MPLTISRILHAGYVFECEGRLIAFDPIFENPFSRNCHAFPEVRFDHARIRQVKLSENKVCWKKLWRFRFGK